MKQSTRNIIGSSAIAFGLLLLAHACRNPSNGGGTTPTPPAPKIVDENKYNQITKGKTLEQVNSIIGFQGSKHEQLPGAFIWRENDTKSITVVFEHGSKGAEFVNYTDNDTFPSVVKDNYFPSPASRNRSVDFAKYSAVAKGDTPAQIDTKAGFTGFQAAAGTYVWIQSTDKFIIVTFISEGASEVTFIDRKSPFARRYKAFPGGNGEVTKSKYDGITRGSTLDEVNQIMGFQGSRHNELPNTYVWLNIGTRQSISAAFEFGGGARYVVYSDLTVSSVPQYEKYLGTPENAADRSVNETKYNSVTKGDSLTEVNGKIGFQGFRITSDTYAWVQHSYRYISVTFNSRGAVFSVFRDQSVRPEISKYKNMISEDDYNRITQGKTLAQVRDIVGSQGLYYGEFGSNVYSWSENLSVEKGITVFFDFRDRVRHAVYIDKVQTPEIVKEKYLGTPRESSARSVSEAQYNGISKGQSVSQINTLTGFDGFRVNGDSYMWLQSHRKFLIVTFDRSGAVRRFFIDLDGNRRGPETL